MLPISATEENIFSIYTNTDEKHMEFCGVDLPIGKLLYNSWAWVYHCIKEFEWHIKGQDGWSKADDVFKYGFTSAILEGDLPSWFKSSIEKYREIWNKKFKTNPYVDELRRRNYRGIKWDGRLLILTYACMLYTYYLLCFIKQRI